MLHVNNLGMEQVHFVQVILYCSCVTFDTTLRQTDQLNTIFFKCGFFGGGFFGIKISRY